MGTLSSSPTQMIYSLWGWKRCRGVSPSPEGVGWVGGWGGGLDSRFDAPLSLRHSARPSALSWQPGSDEMSQLKTWRWQIESDISAEIELDGAWQRELFSWQLKVEAHYYLETGGEIRNSVCKQCTHCIKQSERRVMWLLCKWTLSMRCTEQLVVSVVYSGTSLYELKKLRLREEVDKNKELQTWISSEVNLG